jgi:hypothetical protein
MNIEDRYNLAPIGDAPLEMYEKLLGTQDFIYPSIDIVIK